MSLEPLSVGATKKNQEKEREQLAVVKHQGTLRWSYGPSADVWRSITSAISVSATLAPSSLASGVLATYHPVSDAPARAARPRNGVMQEPAQPPQTELCPSFISAGRCLLQAGDQRGVSLQDSASAHEAAARNTHRRFGASTIRWHWPQLLRPRHAVQTQVAAEGHGDVQTACPLTLPLLAAGSACWLPLRTRHPLTV